MKRTVLVLSTLLVVFVAVLAVLVLRPVRKVKAGGGCSNGSLSGSYAFMMKGQYEFLSVYAQEWDMSMLATFDGKGNLSGSSVIGAYDGYVYANQQFTGGTYTVNYDCSVSVNIPRALPAFYDTPVHLVGIVSSPGNVAGTGAFVGGPDYYWSGSFYTERVGVGD
jgi:hypothetical protein